MNKPVPLDSLFKEKLFRIPDYQRGYAWQKDQLGDFWEDLLNLDEDRSHYTGVLTLKNIPSKNIKSDSNEYWLVEDHSYNLYYIVDGQQRITTFVIFVQCVIDFLKKLSENVGKSDEEIYLTESLNLEAIAKKYLYEIRPTGIKFRTYKFGYAVDNPSYQFLRYRIFNEQNPGAIQETFYTLNLKNAKTYFIEQLEALYKDEGLAAIQSLYKKLTKNFLFNEYVIETEIDEFIAFETMNNRGKQLSKLELLKNRLIYLATLYPENELDDASRAELRRDINDAWKEIYYQLGRNEKHPLNDDDFLRAHWTMYFKYSRKAADDYIKFLLGEQFSSKKIYKKIEVPVIMDVPIEHKEDISAEDYDKDGSDADNNGEEYVMATSTLSPKEISDYVKNIRASALHWFNSHFPDLASELNSEEKEAIRKLNRVGMLYFRPLVMAVLKSNAKPADRVRLFNKIERFIFICFRLCQARSNYRDSEFYNTAREFDKGEINISQIIKKISDREAWVSR